MNLAEALRDFLPRQRWYAAKGRSVDDVRIVDQALLGVVGPSRLYDVLADVVFADGAAERYQLPVGLRTGELPERFLHGHEPAFIGTVEHDGERGLAYDGLVDGELTGLWLALLRRQAATGFLRFVSTLPATPGAPDAAGRLVGAEQSNSSLVFGDDYILKLFRRPAPGVNPDLELPLALAQAGNKHVAEPVGWVEAPDGTTLGVCQPYYRSATEGWALALTSVRDLYAERDLHPNEVGGDFGGEARRLGAVTAELHADLARAFPSRLADAADVDRLVTELHRRLSAVTAAVPALAGWVPAVAAAYDALRSYDGPLRLQRIHGDYHLGQVVRLDTGWLVLDFEGEPSRPLAERTAPASPLRDVAGMLRSFDYAARHLVPGHSETSGLAHRATEWVQRNRAAFLEGYAEAGGGDTRHGPLLHAFELDKAVYEAGYEAGNRPGWLHIPLAGIRRLVQP